MSVQARTTPELIDRMFELRDSKRLREAQIKELTSEIDEIKFELIGRFQSDGTEVTATAKATASITETTVPNVTNWDQYYEFIKQEDAFYLLEKRPSTAAWRELHNSGQTPPGTAAFVKYDINLRKR
jgi:ribonuclease HII